MLHITFLGNTSIFPSYLMYNMCMCEYICMYYVNITYMCAHPLSCIQLSVTPWTTACQSTLSVGFLSQENWRGLPFPSPGDLPNSAIESGSPAYSTPEILHYYSFLQIFFFGDQECVIQINLHTVYTNKARQRLFYSSLAGSPKSIVQNISTLSLSEIIKLFYSGSHALLQPENF